MVFGEESLSQRASGSEGWYNGGLVWHLVPIRTLRQLLSSEEKKDDSHLSWDLAPLGHSEDQQAENLTGAPLARLDAGNACDRSCQRGLSLMDPEESGGDGGSRANTTCGYIQ
jgi:hypothetical protein